MTLPHSTISLLLALALASRAPILLQAELTWFNPALGSINCDYECMYMGHDTPVAAWYGRAAACPPEVPRGSVIRIKGSRNADGYWRCLDGGGAVIMRDGVASLDLLSRIPIHRETLTVQLYTP